MRWLYLKMGVLFFFICTVVNAQDSLLQLPRKYYDQIGHKSKQLTEQLDHNTDKALAQLVRRERKMQAKLSKIDSAAAKHLFITSPNTIKEKLLSKLPAGAGSGYLDTLQNTLGFLQQSKQFTNTQQLQGALQNVTQLQDKLQTAEQLKAYIRERREQLKTQLASYTGFTKDLQQLNKQAYYYGEQMKEYKSLLSDPKRAEAKVMLLLKQFPAYNDFISRNSQLAGLFNLSSNYNDVRNIEGLQTRSQTEQLISQRLGSSPDARQAVSQQMDQARSKFDELKSKFPDLDNAGEMPDFKPNEMKNKKLIQRLEFGGNIQFQRSSQYFPITSDIAGQVAYKFNKNGSIGIGLAYKLGLGNGWDNIRFSHQGLGLRAFADYKLRGTFFINGGYEGNYASGFEHINELRNWSGWNTSLLAGISKKYKINNKLKGNIMVLYDFLAPQQLPKSDAIKIRMGYNF